MTRVLDILALVIVALALAGFAAWTYRNGVLGTVAGAVLFAAVVSWAVIRLSDWSFR